MKLYQIYWFPGNEQCLLDIATNLNSGIPKIILRNINIGKTLYYYNKQCF